MVRVPLGVLTRPSSVHVSSTPFLSLPLPTPTHRFANEDDLGTFMTNQELELGTRRSDVSNIGLFKLFRSKKKRYRSAGQSNSPLFTGLFLYSCLWNMSLVGCCQVSQMVVLNDQTESHQGCYSLLPQDHGIEVTHFHQLYKSALLTSDPRKLEFLKIKSVA
ncbi:unnamed protein product [Protopolystoma xenopodis]|uniref:Uncharacterized protein n=1 Tax=Protopolystoma xenopodis TaxID=117903 RepID=A0A3S5B088_9PLAT|nr:unnamed protein product [Protopolystoma xenopodis]